MTINRDSWPEFVYRFVEHYRWEPQHLGPDTTAFYRKVRSQEVPLNFLANILLHALPPRMSRSMLAITGAISPRGPLLRVRNSKDTSFTQADVQLESENERIFVELKVRAKTNLEQAQKYALLHTRLAADDPTRKKPSLLYVTERKFVSHWSPAKEAPTNGHALARWLHNAELSEKLARNREVRTLEPSYRALCAELCVGFTTWQDIGDHLARRSGGASDIAKAFIDGSCPILVVGICGRPLPSKALQPTGLAAAR